MKRPDDNSRLVYTSASGRICPGCEQPRDRCRCRKSPNTVGSGKVRVHRETKGRRGKGVTVVTGLPVSAQELMTLCKELKRLCGSGGTVRDGSIEIQGDHRETLVAELIKRGHAAKKSGG